MQQKRANPLLSRLGCATTIVMVSALGIILLRIGGGPFSPGPLSAAGSRQEALSGFASHADFEAECGRCHAPWQGATADRCQSCHTDVAEQRSTGSGIHGRLVDTADCGICHTEHEGRIANITSYDLHSFEHDWLTDFSLVQHQTDFDDHPIDCEACHPRKAYSRDQVACWTCHATAAPTYMDEHAILYGDDCQYCHDGQDSMVGFDHQVVFPLEGGHAIADCRACHATAIMAGTPGNCSDCHAEPAIHASQFGLDCVRCHTVQAWLPAQLTIHTFPLDHGGEGKIACQVCHVSRYDEYTCTNCHAHDPVEIKMLHIEAEIIEFKACINCHPTGFEGDFNEESA